MLPTLTPSESETARRDEVVARIVDYTVRGETIRLPAFDGSAALGGELEAALLALKREPNAFSGTVGDYWYQFEGEEDLLHLIVARCDGAELTPEDAQAAAGFVLAGVPPALIWLKPGKVSQHFYLGHDLLVQSSRREGY